MEPSSYDPSTPRELHKRVTKLEAQAEAFTQTTDNGWPDALVRIVGWLCIAVCVIAVTRCMAGH